MAQYIDPNDLTDTAILDLIDELEIELSFNSDSMEFSASSRAEGGQIMAKGHSVRQSIRRLVEQYNALFTPQPADTVEEFYHD